MKTALDLSPAKWIWLPSERCLPNTFILFRRELKLATVPRSARGWLTADSRYRLTVNGRRIQWGPAPCDPRWQEADPFDITLALRVGENVIGVEVCYFGQGDGTWPMGAPGFIFRMEIDGQTIVSDSSWQTFLDRAHRPGMYKRWFLRAMQEEFDARLYPYGWDSPGTPSERGRPSEPGRPGPGSPGSSWLPARELPGSAKTPAIFAGGPEYVLGCDQAGGTTGGSVDFVSEPELRPREIPLIAETIIPAKGLTETGRVKWLRDPNDWFESRVPGSFEITRDPRWVAGAESSMPRPLQPQEPGLRSTSAPATHISGIPAPDEGLFFTYELADQVVGFPRFTIDAPAGTIVELMARESHDPVNGPAWMDNYIYHWTRFICRGGVNEFECFDYESLKWIQLHVRNTTRPVTIKDVGVRRREYAWPNTPDIKCGEPALQRLFDASVNTLRNSCIDTVVDGHGRERQQYSGDGSHQLHAARYAFGDAKLSARFIKTFSQGMTLDGFFLDCWPAFDRLARLMQRQIGTTVWGPLLDHGVGFSFDCWNHYMETGDLDGLREPYPRLKRFAKYLAGLRRDDGMLPVEDIGVPTVWMDHWAYQQQSHKRCAFNLYVSAMLQHALARIVAAFGEDPEPHRRMGAEIQAAVVGRYWSKSERLFVVDPNGPLRTCDRSLATSILFDQCPNGDTQAAVRTLAETPATMGLSYPCNAVWRYWALAKGGRTDVILKDFREKWATMNSVIYNNTLQETFETKMDDMYQFSHCPLAPLVMLYQSLAGIRPTAPGFAKCEIRPQLADIGDLHLIAHTPHGPIAFDAKRKGQSHDVHIRVPAGCETTLIVSGTPPRIIPGEVNLELPNN